MIQPPTIVRTEARPTAVIRLKVPRDEIQQVMGPAIGEVIAAVAAQGVGPAGPVYSHHFHMSPETFDFAVGVPVKEPVEPAGRVEPGELPAATVARTEYRGSYEGLPEAWGEFDSWIQSEGHRAAEDLWECYLAGPESDPDPATWRTQLNRPLQEARV